MVQNEKEKSKNKLPIILAAVLLVILIALAIIYLVISNHDVKEVKAGYECGFVFANFNDIKEGDLVEAFKMVEIPR